MTRIAAVKSSILPTLLLRLAEARFHNSDDDGGSQICQIDASLGVSDKGKLPSDHWVRRTLRPTSVVPISALSPQLY
jgi:hypothetical protein